MMTVTVDQIIEQWTGTGVWKWGYEIRDIFRLRNLDEI